MKPRKVIYIVSDVDKALAFEWIAERIDKRKYELSFILLLQRPAVLENYLNSKNIKCHSLYYYSKKDLLSKLWQVYKILKAEKPCVVHCHLLYGSLIGLTASWLAGVKTRIYTRHHSDYHHRYFPKGVKWDKWCNSMATSIIAPSGAVKDVLELNERVEANKIKVVHHGFDLRYFSEVPLESIEALREKYNTRNNYPVIGVISRFTELKGIQYIIPAFKKLLDKYPHALLLLFNARGDYERELKQLLTLIPNQHFRLIPFENDLSAVYRLFDVFVQASTDKPIEAFGQTYVEALASGVPSVFTLSGIAVDFIKNRHNALVVPFRDSEAIYNAMLELLTNRDLQERLRANGRESVENRFTIQNMIQKLEDIYAEA